MLIISAENIAEWGLLTDIMPIYRERNRVFESVDWTILKNSCPPSSNQTTLKIIKSENKILYFTIATLWELKQKLDENKDGRSWVFAVYIPESEVEKHYFKLYYDYDDLGRETTVTEKLYFVEDIKRYVKVTAGSAY